MQTFFFNQFITLREKQIFGKTIEIQIENWG